MRNVRMGMKIQAPLIQSHIDADTIQIVIRFTNIIPTRVSSPLDRDEKWWGGTNHFQEGGISRYIFLRFWKTGNVYTALFG